MHQVTSSINNADPFAYSFYPLEDEKTQKAVVDALSGSPQLVDNIGRYFYETTQNLLAESSFTLVGKKTYGVDIARHVLRTVPIHWVATDLVSGRLFQI